MSEPLAYISGSFVPRSQAALHVFDLGIVGGIAVAELLRTFRHQPFRLDQHLERLQQSLELSGLTLPVSQDELRRIIAQVVASQSQITVPESDFGLVVFVTAGLNPTYIGSATARSAGPTLGVHTFDLQFTAWAQKYETGIALATPPQHALPRDLVDRRIKSRSRMHWFLADRAARAIDPEASALLLDDAGHITETAAANFCAVIENTIVSPPEGTVLEGVSLGMVRDLAAEQGILFQRRRLTVEEAWSASECFVTSTTYGVLPVVRLQQRAIGAGTPGEIVARLLTAWSDYVGVDLRAQARNQPRP